MEEVSGVASPFHSLLLKRQPGYPGQKAQVRKYRAGMERV